MNFIDKDIMNYVVNNSEDEPELLKELAIETYQKILQPRMLSGHPQGRILSLLSKIIKPKRILEIVSPPGLLPTEMSPPVYHELTSNIFPVLSNNSFILPFPLKSGNILVYSLSYFERIKTTSS